MITACTKIKLQA